MQRGCQRPLTREGRLAEFQGDMAYPRLYVSGMMRRTMQGLRELVGRAMLDADFLVDLQRAPEAILAQYELSDDERVAIRLAIDRLSTAPSPQRAQALRTALLRRVAT